MQPRDTKELEVDVTDAMYSSSQQINGQQKPGILCIHLLRAQECFTMYAELIVHCLFLCQPLQAGKLT